MRKILSVAMLIVGTMIGAGFCSGREIVSFFGSGVSVLVAPLCGVCIFFICVLFLSIGARIRKSSFDQVNGVLMGKCHGVADAFLLINNLIVLSAMIAGLNSLLRPVIDFPVVGVAAAVLCALIAAKGANGMLNCNFVVVPFLIVALAAVCVSGLHSGDLSASTGVFRITAIPVSGVYVSMNMMLASTVLTTLGDLSRKQIIGGSLIASICITALLALIITALNCTGNFSAELPILEISAGGGKWMYVLLGAVTGISIFTTMLTAVGGLCGYLKGKWGGTVFNAVVVIAAGTTLSFLGFTRVVSLFYPLVGVLGIVYVIVCIRFVRREKRPLSRRVRKAKQKLRPVRVPVSGER